jgi:NADH:ubiquinone oxidoreductase subunit 6 (subunit J)
MNNRTTPKDFFLHLGAVISLYLSVGFIISLWFSLINKWFPDTVYSYFSASDSIVSLSTIIISIPVLYVLEYFISKIIKSINEKRDIWIRKWRIYLTLFLAGLMVAIDLIVLLGSYLRGELTERFILKVLVVLVISIIVFVFYLLERMSDGSAVTATTLKAKKIFGFIGLIFAIATVVTTFVVVGSPTHQRNLRLDEQTINQLRTIRQNIITQYQGTGKLPKDKSSIKDFGTMRMVVDKTEDSKTFDYEYNVIDAQKLDFALCAHFNESYTASQDKIGMNYYNYESDSEWDHDAGRYCFNFNIDKIKYPVRPDVSVRE